MTQAIADRLRALATALADGRMSEFTMRVPVEPDRDADVVMMRAARRLEVAQRLADAAQFALELAEDEWFVEGGTGNGTRCVLKLRAALSEWKEIAK